MPEQFNVLTVSRSIKFFDRILPLIETHLNGKAFFAADSSEAKKQLMTSSFDAVIINAPLPDGFGIDFSLECAVKKNLPVLMLIPKEYFEPANGKLKNSGILTLPKPTTGETLSQTLLLLKATSVNLKKLSDSASKTAAADELKTLTRAKMLLISSLGMSEEQAHKYIERRAMEARKTKIYIAQSIIKSYGN